jgi:hypothetical protein
MRAFRTLVALLLALLPAAAFAAPAPYAGSQIFYILNVATANALSGSITVSCLVLN